MNLTFLFLVFESSTKETLCPTCRHVPRITLLFKEEAVHVIQTTRRSPTTMEWRFGKNDSKKQPNSHRFPTFWSKSKVVKGLDAFFRYPTSMAPGSQYLECLGQPKDEDFTCSDQYTFDFSSYKSYIKDHRHYFEVEVSIKGQELSWLATRVQIFSSEKT